MHEHTHTHIHTQAHSHKASTKKHNSTKVRVNESANRLHFPTLGSFSASEIKQKASGCPKPGQGLGEAARAKVWWFFLLESRLEGTGQGCQLPPFTPHCVPRSWCNDFIWGREGVKNQWGGQKADFLSPPLFFFNDLVSFPVRQC